MGEHDYTTNTQEGDTKELVESSRSEWAMQQVESQPRIQNKTILKNKLTNKTSADTAAWWYSPCLPCKTLPADPGFGYQHKPKTVLLSLADRVAHNCNSITLGDDSEF